MTQLRLIEIAVREFGARGLEGASTRAIAAAAGTAMSSITYHYGGKEGLYLAAADHIAAYMAYEMAPALAAEAGVGADDPAGARAALHRLLGRLLDKMAGTDSDGPALFILREQQQPGEAFDRIWGGVMGQVSHRIADLICSATGADGPAARIAAVTLMGQVMAIRASRAAALRLIGVTELDPTTFTQLKARIAANVDAVLDRMIAEEQA